MEKKKVIDPETGEEVVNNGEVPETPPVEEPTPPEEETEREETPPSESGVKPEVKLLLDEFGVPLQNRAKEYERKLRDAEAKIQELQEKGKVEEADELESLLKEIEESEEPITPAQFRKLSNAIGYRVTRTVARTIGPMMASQNIIDAQIDRLKGQNFEPKAEAILRAKLRQVPPQNLIDDPEGISNSCYDMALGQLAREGKLETKPKQPKRLITPGAPKIEGPGTPPSMRGKKPFTEFEKAEAERMNITPEQYREIMGRREKRRKEKEEK